jgi:hypothetical protein
VFYIPKCRLSKVGGVGSGDDRLCGFDVIRWRQGWGIAAGGRRLRSSAAMGRGWCCERGFSGRPGRRSMSRRIDPPARGSISGPHVREPARLSYQLPRPSDVDQIRLSVKGRYTESHDSGGIECPGKSGAVQCGANHRYGKCRPRPPGQRVLGRGKGDV